MKIMNHKDVTIEEIINTLKHTNGNQLELIK